MAFEKVRADNCSAANALKPELLSLRPAPCQDAHAGVRGVGQGACTGAYASCRAREGRRDSAAASRRWAVAHAPANLIAANSHAQGAYVWFNHPEDTWSPAKVTTGGNEDISIEMVDGGLVRAPHFSAACVSPCGLIGGALLPSRGLFLATARASSGLGVENSLRHSRWCAGVYPSCR